MFNQMQWIAANEPVSAFDFNGNGRIDFNDIVKFWGDLIQCTSLSTTENCRQCIVEYFNKTVRRQKPKIKFYIILTLKLIIP